MRESYNTQQKDITLKEYGRNIQNIVEHILSIEDRELRTKYAHTCIELMRQLTPVMRDAQEQTSKLWDQLYIMSNFKLDVDTPYPMPEITAIGKKPMIVAYNNNNLHYKHYGKNTELLIAKAIAIEDEEEKESAVIHICKMMKRFYATWNKENVDDEVIYKHLREISKGKLDIDMEKVKSMSLFDSNVKDRPMSGMYDNNSGNSNTRTSNNFKSGGSRTNNKNMRSSGGNGNGNSSSNGGTSRNNNFNKGSNNNFKPRKNY